MKIKIVESGWENFTGNLGITAFEGGVTVNDITSAEFYSISGNIRVVDAETGEAASGLDCDAQVQNMPFISTRLQTLEEILAEQAASGYVAPVVVAPQDQAIAQRFTLEELEALADKNGIAGLREIGDTIGVKGTSIAGLIESILAKQAPVEPAAAPLVDGQPDVVTTEQAQ